MAINDPLDLIAEDDPELLRAIDLLRAAGAGVADEAQLGELELYRASNPAVVARAQARLAADAREDGWLDRVHADRAVVARERTGWTRAERGVGVVLILGGWVASVGASVLGPGAMIAGAGLLLFSFIRTRVASLRDDPYRKVQQ